MGGRCPDREFAMTTFTRMLGLATLGATIAVAATTWVPAWAPAWAESPAECQSMFQSADLDDDGLLSPTEIASSDAISGELADSLADRAGASLHEFMAECTD
jgi:hypothetical protein